MVGEEGAFLLSVVNQLCELGGSHLPPHALKDFVLFQSLVLQVEKDAPHYLSHCYILVNGDNLRLLDSESDALPGTPLELLNTPTVGDFTIL